MPNIDIGKHGITIKDSYNLELMKSTLINGIETVPISYCVGDIPLKDVSKSRLNLLSGSNSGGKTMCLLTLAHTAILAQMGFPVSGKVNCQP